MDNFTLSLIFEVIGILIVYFVGLVIGTGIRKALNKS